MSTDADHSGRFCLADSASMNAKVAEILTAVRDGLEVLPEKNWIRSVVLGGSYGRGEGGIYRRNGISENLYNDLDLFVLTRGIGRLRLGKLKVALRQLEPGLSERFGIDVEFGPPTDERQLSGLMNTLMWKELRAGFVPVYGDPSALFSQPEPDWSEIPLSEGARLLMNRSCGLFWALEKLFNGEFETESQRAFILRNFNKALLGGGDALLIVHHAYSPGVQMRAEILRKIEPDFADGYQEAVHFKCYPEDRPEEFLWTMASRTVLFLREAWFRFFGLALGESDPARIEARLYERAFVPSKGGTERVKNFIRALRDGRRPSFSHPRNRLFALTSTKLLDNSLSEAYIKELGKKKNSKQLQSFTDSELFRLWRKYN